METTAYEFSAACEAGLILAGIEDKSPQWIGDKQQWQRFGQLINWWESGEYMSLPWLNKSPF